MNIAPTTAPSKHPQPLISLPLVDGLAYEVPIAESYQATLVPHPEGFAELVFQLNGTTLFSIEKNDFLAMCEAGIKLLK